MKSRITTIVTLLMFLGLMFLVFVFYAQAQVKVLSNQNSNVNIDNRPHYQTTKLPSELSKNLVRYMAIGEVGYNTPSAMLVDEDGNCFLQGNFSNEANKNEDMKYGWIRIEKKKDGYYIYVVKSDKTLWAREHIPYQRDKLERGEIVRVKQIIIVK